MGNKFTKIDSLRVFVLLKADCNVLYNYDILLAIRLLFIPNLNKGCS